jgi:hypothetical protein
MSGDASPSRSLETMSAGSGDFLIRVRGFHEAEGAYPLEAELDDGSHAVGELRLDWKALLASHLDARRYGTALFESLLAGKVGRAYEQATARAESGTEGRLRVRLWIDEQAAELHAVSWERLLHIRHGQPAPVAISELTPFSRYTALEIGAPEQLPTRPVHVLFAVSNPVGLPNGLTPLNVDQEVRTIHQALGDLNRDNELTVTVLPGQAGLSPGLRQELEADGYAIEEDITSLDTLTRLLPIHEVVHFVGHGHFDREAPTGEGRAALYLEEEGGHWDAVTDDDLVDRILAVEPPSPYVVFLSACESARQEADSTHPFVGLGPKLIRAGVPAVVGMQRPVPVMLARELTLEFYRSLVTHGKVDVALNRARLFLFDRDEADWAIPVLFTRLRDGRLFVPSRLANRVVAEDILIQQTEHGARGDRVKEPHVKPIRREPPIRALPRDFPDLLGREDDVAATTAALGAGRAVELCGEKGLGKTALLRHLSHRPPEKLDGVVHVAALDQPVEDLLQFLFDRLYQTDGAYKPTPGQLRELLADARVLFALDDAELSREDVQRLLDAAPQTLFLLTAREPNLLGEGEVIQLKGLPGRAAVALLERHLGRPLNEGEADAAGALCQTVQGNPQEIIRVAARVRYESLTVNQVLTEEKERRARGVGAAIGAADVTSLPAGDQRIMGVLAAMGDTGISPEHVEALADEPQIISALRRLEGLGLAKTASPSFTVAERTDPEAEKYLETEAWRERILEHFIEWCERNRDDPGRILGSIDSILAILAWARRSGRSQEFIRLAPLTEEALIVGRRWETWRSLLLEQLEEARAVGDEGLRAWVLHQLGTHALGQKQRRTARRRLKEALRLRRSLGDRAGARITRHNLRVLPISIVPPFLATTFIAALVLVGLFLVPLGGAAIGIQADPEEVGFGDVTIGSAVSRSVTVAPTEGQVVIRDLAFEPPLDEFRIRGTTCGGALRDECVVEILFRPDAVGPLEAELLVSYNGPESPKAVLLSGTGVAEMGAAAVALEPESVDFGRVRIEDQGEPVTVTVTNEGDSDLDVEDIRIDRREFAVLEEDCRGRPIPPNQSCRVILGFVALDRGRVDGQLVVVDSAEGSPHTVPLSGFGAVDLPDLLIRDLRLNGDPVLGPNGEILVPVLVVVANEGDVAAVPFKVAAEYTSASLRVSGPFLAFFQPEETESVVGGDGFAFTTDELSWIPGENEIPITGMVVFSESRQGDEVEIFAVADSCAGEEFVPDECRVSEFDENNNRSSGVRVTLPVAASPSPETVD